MDNLPQLFSAICLATRQAGIIAKNFQGKVSNEGKEAEQITANETERLKARRAAKTLIDEVVQDTILLSIQEILSPNEVLLDAEEETPMTKLFLIPKDSDISLIIDPIDGTLEYLEGKDCYSVCVGLVENGQMKLALVYFPARDAAYAIAADGHSYMYSEFETAGIAHAKKIVLPKTAEKIIYKNNRVPPSILQPFMQKGFTIIDDSEDDLGCPDAILKIIDGKSQAYISDNRNMRDILLGAIIANAEGGFASDFTGEPLHWPKKGRVKEAIFKNKELL